MQESDFPPSPPPLRPIRPKMSEMEDVLFFGGEEEENSIDLAKELEGTLLI